MPTRRLANSNTSRYCAQQIAEEMKDAMPPPSVIPIAGTTSARLNVFYRLYKSNILTIHILTALGEIQKPVVLV